MFIIFLDLIDDPAKHDLFVHIYNTYSDYLYAVINRILKDHTETEDALQELFFKLAKNIYKIDARSEMKLKAYLRRAAINTAYTYWRKRRKKMDYEEPLDEYEDYDADDAVVLEIFDRLSIVELSEIIRKMDEEDRNVLFLRFNFEMSLKEIGKSLGISAEAARKRVERAKKKLAVLLNEEGIDRGKKNE